MNINLANNKKINGFTIIELLIATAAFSIMLVIIAFSVNYFAIKYYQSLTTINTQGNLISTINNISQSIKFSLQAPNYSLPSTSNPVGYLCTSSTEYVFYINQPFFKGSINNNNSGIIQYPIVQNTCLTPSSLPALTGQQLLGNNMRPLYFNISSINTNLYNLTIEIAYTGSVSSGIGNSLLCSPKISPNNQGGCGPDASNLTTTQDIKYAPTIGCKPTAVSQFCDVSTLQTTSSRRIN